MQSGEKPVIRGIDIVTYMVKNVQRAIVFYRDTMGMQMTADYEGPGAEFTFGDNSTFAVYQTTADKSAWRPCAGVTFGVEDINAAIQLYLSRGVHFEGGDHPTIDDNPYCYMAFAEDSEGNSFILHQRKL